MIENKNFVITQQNVELYAGKLAEWIKNKVQNAGASGVVLGMSGGVDCSVVARLCQIADVSVDLILMPYGDNMERSGSMKRSMELINKFSFRYHIHDIQPAVDAMFLEGCKSENINLAKANLRPRVRTAYSYQFAQAHRKTGCWYY